MEILRCQIDMVLVSFLYGVMRLWGLSPSKKVKKLCDNYLTSTGWGVLCLRDSLPV